MLEAINFPTISGRDDHDHVKMVKYEIRAVLGPAERRL